MSNVLLTERARAFYEDLSVSFRIHPDLGHSARLPPLPDSVDGFREKGSCSPVSLAVHSVYSVFEGNSDLVRDAGRMNVGSAIKAVVQSIRPNPLDSMIGFTFLLPLPLRGGLSIDVKQLFLDAYARERKFLDSRWFLPSSESTLHRLLAFERELFSSALQFYQRDGCVPGYRAVASTLRTYQTLLDSHVHHTVGTFERFREVLRHSAGGNESERASPLPAIFGTRHNSIFPYVDLVRMAAAGEPLENAMSLLVRVVTTIVLQYFAIANGRFFERDPTCPACDLSKPQFLILIFLDCDAYTNIRRVSMAKKRTVTASKDAVRDLEQDSYWMKSDPLTAENVTDLVVKVPFRLFLQKVFDFIIPLLDLGDKALALKRKAGHMLFWNVLKNTKQYLMTTGFMPVDVSPSCVESLNSAYREARVPNAEDQTFRLVYKKCFVTNGSVEMANLIRPEKRTPELICGRLAPSFFSHVYMTPYAPVFAESVEERMAIRILCARMRVPRISYFPLVDHPAEVANADAESRGQYVAYKLEMQNRAMVRAARFVTREDLLGLRQTLADDFNAGFPEAQVPRPYYFLTSQACLLPAATNELLVSPDALQFDDGEMDFHVRQEQRRHSFLQQLRYTFFVNQSQFCAFLPALHVPYEPYPECIRSAMSRPWGDDAIPAPFVDNWTSAFADSLPVVSPVFSLTMSSFYALYKQGASRLSAHPNVSFTSNPVRMVIGLTSQSQHALVYNPSLSAHEEKDGWTVGTFRTSVLSTKTAFAVRRCHGVIDVSARERAASVRELVRVVQALHALTQSQSWIVFTVGAFYRSVSGSRSVDRQEFLREKSGQFEANVLLVYRLLHFFFSHEEDVIYCLIRIFGADEPMALNNANCVSYGENGFCIPFYMAILHRALLRAHYADSEHAKEAIRAATVANYCMTDLYEVHPLQNALIQSLTAWDGCSAIRPSVEVLSKVVRCKDLLTILGFPKALQYSASEALDKVPIAQALCSAVLVSFEDLAKCGLEIKERELWAALTAQDTAFAFVAVKNGSYWKPCSDRAGFFESVVVDSCSEAWVSRIFAQESSTVRMNGLEKVSWELSPDAFVSLLFYVLDEIVFRPLRRYLHHRTPVDLVRFENGDSWVQRMMKHPSEEPFLNRVFRTVRHTVSTLYEEELHRKRVKRTPHRSKAWLAARASASDEAASDTSGQELRGVLDDAMETTRTPEGVAKLGLLYALAPHDSRFRQDLTGLMGEVNGHVRAILPEAFVAAKDAESRLLMHFGTAILHKQVLAPSDVDVAVRFWGVLGRSSPAESLPEFVARRIVLPLCNESFLIDPLVRAQCPPDRVLHALRGIVARTDVSDPLIRVFIAPSVFESVIRAIERVL